MGEDIRRHEVWIYARHAPGSGGYRALTGIAEHVAAQTGLAIRHVTERDVIIAREKSLKDWNAVPGATREAFHEAFGRAARDDWTEVMSWMMMKDHGVPKIILTDQTAYEAAGRLHLGEAGLGRLSLPAGIAVHARLQFLNFHRYSDLGRDWLVPHDMTAAKIETAAAEWQAGDRHPLGWQVALNLAAPREKTFVEFLTTLPHIVEANPGRDFALIGSPRTPPEQFNYLARYLRDVNDGVGVEAFPYEKDGGYNPYAALLSARNFIVVGESHSMVSERLVAGRPAHVFYDSGDYCHEANYGTQIEQGRVVDLRECDDFELAARAFTPVDVTPDIAGKIVADYRARTFEPVILPPPPPLAEALTGARHAQDRPRPEKWRGLFLQR